MEFHFRRHFRLWPKMKNAFRSASSMHIGLEMQSLGLGLSWSWKKVLITSLRFKHLVESNNFVGRNICGCSAEGKATLPMLTEFAHFYDIHQQHGTYILSKDVHNLERIQRRAARFVTNDYHRTTSITSLLSQLYWPLLSTRWRNRDLTKCEAGWICRAHRHWSVLITWIRILSLSPAVWIQPPADLNLSLTQPCSDHWSAGRPYRSAYSHHSDLAIPHFVAWKIVAGLSAVLKFLKFLKF